jgi:Ca2+-transporting ATPase
MQLLWINLVTDTFPAIALGMEPVAEDIMDAPPKPKKEGLFAHGFGLQIILQGIMFGALALTAYYLGITMVGEQIAGYTMAFAVLSLSQVVHSFNMRTEKSLFKINPFGNKKLNLAALFSLLMVALVMFTPLNKAFELTILPWYMYLIALGLIITPLIVIELSKALGLIKHDKK